MSLSRILRTVESDAQAGDGLTKRCRRGRANNLETLLETERAERQTRLEPSLHECVLSSWENDPLFESAKAGPPLSTGALHVSISDDEILNDEDSDPQSENESEDGPSSRKRKRFAVVQYESSVFYQKLFQRRKDGSFFCNLNVKDIRSASRKSVHHRDIKNEEKLIRHLLRHHSGQLPSGVNLHAPDTLTEEAADQMLKIVNEPVATLKRFFVALPEANNPGLFLLRLVFFFSKCGISLRVVESDWFWALFSDPKVRRVSRRTLARAVRIVYTAVMVDASRRISSLTTIAFTFDGWADRRMDDYYGVTAHGISDDWQVVKCVVGFEKMEGSATAEAVARCVKKVVSEVTDSSIILSACITDNAATECLASDLKSGKGNGVRCASHTLQLIVKHSLNDANMEYAIGRIRELIKSIRSHYASCRYLRQAIKHFCPHLHYQTIPLDVPTRWGSTYTMLAVFLQLLQPVLFLLANNVVELSMESSGFCPRDIEVAKAFVKTLKPFEDATTFLGGDLVPTIAAVPGLVVRLRGHVDGISNNIEETPEVRSLASALQRWLSHYYDPLLETDSIHMMAALVSVSHEMPTENEEEGMFELVSAALLSEGKFLFDHLASQKTPKQVKDPSCILSDLAPSYNDTSTRQELLRKELDSYISNKRRIRQSQDFKEFEAKHGNQTDMEWWRNWGTQFYPNLAPVARSFLGIPASSVPSERFFSVTGWLQNEKRSRLTGESLKALAIIASSPLTSSELEKNLVPVMLDLMRENDVEKE